jgi:hypothetical protein
MILILDNHNDTMDIEVSPIDIVKLSSAVTKSSFWRHGCIARPDNLNVFNHCNSWHMMSIMSQKASPL